MTMIGCRPLAWRPMRAISWIWRRCARRSRRARERSSPSRPNNPTGAVYPEADLRAVNALCAEHGIVHITDEAYEYFTYGDARHYSPGATRRAGRTRSRCSRCRRRTGSRVGASGTWSCPTSCRCGQQDPGHEPDLPAASVPGAAAAALRVGQAVLCAARRGARRGASRGARHAARRRGSGGGAGHRWRVLCAAAGEDDDRCLHVDQAADREAQGRRGPGQCVRGD